jgi:2-dehydropantoate 2-reductase
MRIAIMGSGALGCYIGGRLIAADRDVSFIARGRQLEALSRRGLRIESPLGNLAVPTLSVSSDPAEIGPVDLVIFLVKLYDTDTAAHALAPLLGPRTAIVSFQNGIDGWSRIGAIAGHNRVIGGVARLPAALLEPGVVRNGGIAKLDLGELEGTLSERCKEIEHVLKVPGLQAQAVADITTRIWEKFVLLSAMSGVTALTRLPMGAVLSDPLCAELYLQAMQEAAEIGARKCAALPQDVVERQMAFSRSLPASVKASMLEDLENGKRLELNDLSGAVVRLGRELGIATPVHAVIHAALQPFVMGRQPS